MPSLWQRAILHVDMDAFYASVEQLDNPSLRNTPVIVGGAASRRGVVAAASYEARAYGVHSAMPTAKAQRLCLHGVFLPVRMERYREMSRRVHTVFAEFTPDVQPISVDEAFLDITGCQRLFGPPADIGRQLKQRIVSETGLTASVGIAPNRFVAKIASDLEKPDGLVTIHESEVLSRLGPLPVSRIWGVGRVMNKKMQKLGISTIADLRAWPRTTLEEHFGQAGLHLFALARGDDASPVTGAEPEKSISHENTFSRDITSLKELELHLLALSDKVASRLRAHKVYGKTIQLKIRYDDFTTITRRLTLPFPTRLGQDIFRVGRNLMLARTDAGSRPVRLIGIGVSSLIDSRCTQGHLFDLEGNANTEKTERLEATADEIRKKLGAGSIKRGSLLAEDEN